jgi:hypothetical protein
VIRRDSAFTKQRGRHENGLTAHGYKPGVRIPACEPARAARPEVVSPAQPCDRGGHLAAPPPSTPVTALACCGCHREHRCASGTAPGRNHERVPAGHELKKSPRGPPARAAARTAASPAALPKRGRAASRRAVQARPQGRMSASGSASTCGRGRPISDSWRQLLYINSASAAEHVLLQACKSSSCSRQ